ncbi:hypothetical protein QO034_20635 [Sedimentitalea sp. JM2-8]|uniref:DUF1902 domain-containing protein n=1 Tax=Sedimentitalea xiamensis TaxID=3050037 RepID=A0ABT7FK32_9RHOB|nr:hypothetical protein [Sedimentitalea xiamensis]MDK3075486.1 hypothetical protein [Sedimentitalea xiamensis]
MTYEVQTLTLCDGWVNTWFVEYAKGCRYPETFATRAAAQAALDEFFAEIAEEIEIGQRSPDDGYDEDDFRIVQTGAS